MIWAKLIVKTIANLAMKIVGLPIVMVAALRPVIDRSKDEVHFHKAFWYWDNHHDRRSHGVDGTDSYRAKNPNDYWRRVKWAGLRNAASNFGVITQGYRDYEVKTPKYDYPSDWKGISGTFFGYGEVRATGEKLPLLWIVWKYPFVDRCFQFKFGYSLWEDDDEEGDTDLDWVSPKFQPHPWRKFGDRK